MLNKIIIVVFLLLGQTVYAEEILEEYQTGKASYYAHKFHGRKTSNGETFNMYKMTAAHKTLPFGTELKVTNLNNGKEVKVRINDRGPFIKNRIIDLSLGAAKELEMMKSGLADVKIDIIREVFVEEIVENVNNGSN